MTGTTLEIEVEIRAYPAVELKERFDRLSGLLDAGVTTKLKQHGPRRRGGIEPTVLVAIVSTAGAAVGAFLTGVLQIARERKAAKIVLQDKDGRRIEFPADAEPERVDALVDELRAMERPKVTVE